MSKDGTRLISYHGKENDYSLPYLVTEVASYAFYKNTTISNVNVRDGVEWELLPFFETKVKSFKLAEGVTVIPDYLFAGTAMEDVTIPKTVEKIGTKAFYAISTLKTVRFEDSAAIAVIGSYSFSSNPVLSEVSFGTHSQGGACTIEEGAFFNCGSLRTVIVDDEFVLKTIGKAAFAKSRNLSSGVELYAVNFNSAHGIVIPSSVETIEAGAFSNLDNNGYGQYSNVEPGYLMLSTTASFFGYQRSEDTTISAEVGSVLGSIGDYAFAGLLGVVSINLSNCVNLQEVGAGCFRNTYNVAYKSWNSNDTGKPLGRTTIELPESVETIGAGAFNRVSINRDLNMLLDEFTVPGNVSSIGNGSFYGVARNLVFAENSVITEVDGSIISAVQRNEYSLDLTRCSALNSISISQNTKLPSGVFMISGHKEYILNHEAVVDSYSEGRTLLIGAEATTIDSSLLSGEYRLSVNRSNVVFSVENGLLVYHGPSGNAVVGIDSATKDPNIREDSIIDFIADHAFDKSGISVLTIGKSLSFGERIVSGCKNVSVFMTAEPISIEDISLGGAESVKIYLGREIAPSTLSKLRGNGDVYVDTSEECDRLYLPINVSGMDVFYDSVFFEGNIVTIDGLDFGHGYTLYDMVVEPVSSVKVVDKDTLQAIVDSDTIITISVRDRTSGSLVRAVFDANWEFSESSTALIPSGGTIVDSDIPTFTRNGYVFIGWTDTSGKIWNNFDTPLIGNVYLMASWEVSEPVITVDASYGTYKSGNVIVTGSIKVPNGSDITLTVSPYSGFQLFYWVLDGEIQGTPASEPLTISGVTDDRIVSVTARYSSSSTGLQSIVDAGTPAVDELSDLVKVSMLGGYVDRSGMSWTGHSSVPLIVDGYIYFRSGAYLYKAESDTGFIVESVLSKSETNFYHYVGYGDGLIIDFPTRTVYDTNLKKMCYISTSTGLVYNDGYFYTTTTNVQRYSVSELRSSNGSTVVSPEDVGIIKDRYSSYTTSGVEFVGDTMYCVYAGTSSRGIAAMNLSTGDVQYKELTSLRSMFLDDGWLSYYDGTLYLIGYTVGLFNSVATDGYDTIAFVNVDGTTFGEEGHYTVDGRRGFMSEFIVYEGRGYVNASGRFCVFDIGGTGDVGGTRTLTLKDDTISAPISHGSMVMSTYYASEGKLYFYVIPYQSSNATMVVIEYSTDEYSGTGTYTMNLEKNYNSQAIRSDIDGRIVWYNDSGKVFTYTTSDKNVYYFLIQSGKRAEWFAACGATAADALKSLGANVVTLDATKALSTVYGAACEDGKWTIHVLTDQSDKTKAGKIGKYNWVEVGNLYAKTYDTDHYYIITNGEKPTDGVTKYTYVQGSGMGTYTFFNNIGDRSIVGKPMILGTDAVTVRFIDTNGREIEDSAVIGVKDSKFDGSFPTINRYGMKAVWTDEGGNTALPAEFDKDRKYSLSWVNAPNYDLDVKETKDPSRVTFEIGIERDYGREDLDDAYLYAIAYYDDGRFISSIAKIVITGGRSDSVVSVSADSLVDASFRIIVGPVSATEYDNYGETYWKAGAMSR